jgi:uncharacterized protein (DUF488 family)
MGSNLFTVGYTVFDHFEGFLQSLLYYKIQVIVDVRSKPYSSRFLEYNSPDLRLNLRNNGIRYVHMPELGAHPSDESLYVDGIPDWNLIARSRSFRKGIERLRKGMETFRCCLLCAEKEPENCHRAILIGRYLRKIAPMLHIEADDGLTDTEVIELRLLEMYDLDQQENLFESREDVIAEAYKRQTKRLMKRWARIKGKNDERKTEMSGMQNRHAACQ